MEIFVDRAAAGVAGHRANLRMFNPCFLWKRPTLTAATLFLLILSGPPRLRIRDAEASLRGDIDWVVLLHTVVWALAGLWVLVQLGRRCQAGRQLLRIRAPQIFAMAMIVGLAVSIAASDAPALTAFKVYQMLVAMLFTQIFAERFGVQTSLNAMFWGNALLCVAIAVCAVLAPDMVWAPSDFNPEPSRLVGQLIAPAGVVSAFAIILLLTNARKIWKALPISLVVLFLAVLVLSLMRTAYFALLAFFALVLIKRPNVRPLVRFAYLLCALGFLLYACNWLPTLSRYRDPQSISTLSDRTGLWRYLADVTLSHAPWFGLGYYSASRVYSPQYNPGLGTAHSMFVEALVGGGVISAALFLSLCAILSIYAARLLIAARERLSFAVCAVFIATLLFASMVEEIDSGPVAIGFWFTAAALPRLYELYFKKVPRLSRSSVFQSPASFPALPERVP